MMNLMRGIIIKMITSQNIEDRIESLILASQTSTNEYLKHYYGNRIVRLNRYYARTQRRIYVTEKCREMFKNLNAICWDET